MAVTFGKICETCKREYHSESDFLQDTHQWRLCSAENLWFNCSCGSTLMLPKGKFPWYSPSLFMTDEAQSVFNRIAKINNLPHIPAAVMNIQTLLQDDEVEVGELSKALKGDPFLAAEVLRVAENIRNLRNRNQKPMNSLEHAITYIGKKAMADLVLAASIRSFKLPTRVFDEDSFWRQSFTTAALSEILASRFIPQIDKDKAYIAGCLANIGKVIAAICFSDKVDQVQSIVKDVRTMTTWETAENKVGLVSHCLLGEIGAAIWGLPQFVLQAARFHHSAFDSKTAAHKNSVAVVTGFANAITHWINLEPSRIDEQQLNQFKVIFNLSDRDLEDFVNNECAPVKASIKF